MTDWRGEDMIRAKVSSKDGPSRHGETCQKAESLVDRCRVPGGGRRLSTRSVSGSIEEALANAKTYRDLAAVADRFNPRLAEVQRRWPAVKRELVAGDHQ